MNQMLVARMGGPHERWARTRFFNGGQAFSASALLAFGDCYELNRVPQKTCSSPNP